MESRHRFLLGQSQLGGAQHGSATVRKQTSEIDIAALTNLNVTKS
jgi:hypothetical protein